MKKVIVSGLITGFFVVAGILIRGIFFSPHPPAPTPAVVQNINPQQPTPTPTPTPMWSWTVTPQASGSPSLQSGYYYTTVTAHVVNQASDGDTHDVLASAFHLYPVINGSTDFSQQETLSSPNSNADYTIAHNNAMDITLTFLVPFSSSRFEVSLDGASSGG